MAAPVELRRPGAASAESDAERLRVTEVFCSIRARPMPSAGPPAFDALTGCPRVPVAIPPSLSRRQVAFARPRDARWRRTYFHVCVPGGEPLAQKRSLALLRRLCDTRQSPVSLPTSARWTWSQSTRVRKVVDLKAPSSGEGRPQLWDNTRASAATDQLKFVLADRERLRLGRSATRDHDPRRAMPGVLPWLDACSGAIWPSGSSPIDYPRACGCSCTKLLWGDTRASGAGLHRCARRHHCNRATSHTPRTPMTTTPWSRIRRHGFRRRCWPLPAPRLTATQRGLTINATSRQLSRRERVRAQLGAVERKTVTVDLRGIGGSLTADIADAGAGRQRYPRDPTMPGAQRHHAVVAGLEPECWGRRHPAGGERGRLLGLSDCRPSSSPPSSAQPAGHQAGVEQGAARAAPPDPPEQGHIVRGRAAPGVDHATVSCCQADAAGRCLRPLRRLPSARAGLRRCGRSDTLPLIRCVLLRRGHPATPTARRPAATSLYCCATSA